MSGGWIPTVHLTSHHRRQAGMGRRHRRLRAGRACRRAWRRRRRRRRASACGALPDGRRARRRGGGRRLRLRRAPPSSRRRRGRPDDAASAPLWRVAAAAARPSSISRTTSPPTTSRSPHREGYRSVEHLQALHHARHGDRPGQDLERQRRSRIMAELTGEADRRVRAPRPSGRPIRRSPIGALAGHQRGQRLPPDAPDAVA